MTTLVIFMEHREVGIVRNWNTYVRLRLEAPSAIEDDALILRTGSCDPLLLKKQPREVAS